MPNEYTTEAPRNLLVKYGVETSVQTCKYAKQIAPPHIHNAVEFIYILDGEYKVYANDAEYIMSKGDLCLFRSGTVHRTCSLSAGNNCYFVTKIEPSVLLNLASAEHGASYVMHFMLSDKNTKVLWTSDELAGGEIKCAIESILEEHGSDSFGRELALKIYASQLLLSVIRYDAGLGFNTELFSSDVSLTKQIYKSIVFIDSNYYRDITAEECARYINMSYSYFSRSFKRITGRSFKEYLNNTRINQAEKLLLSTDKSVTDICFACGYNNVSYFISQYKSVRGKTPHSFRNSF